MEKTVDERIKELTEELSQVKERLEKCEAAIKSLDEGFDERVDLLTRLK